MPRDRPGPAIPPALAPGRDVPPPVRVAVDLHCHILPGLDDGARDLNDAVAMARQAQADGIDAICATPHIRHDHDVCIPELPERLAQLSTAVRRAGVTTRILSGGEVATTAVAGLSNDELAVVSLGGSRRWILLEPAPGPLNGRLDDAVDALRSRGYRALIAHPERHLAPDLLQRLAGLIERGALVQATAADFTAGSAREGMRSLARAGVVHVLASDAHSASRGRPVAIRAAVDELCTIAPVSSHLDWVARMAPMAIASGAELTAPFAPQLSRTVERRRSG